MPHNHRQADNLDRHLAVGERPNFREKIQQSLLRNRVQLLGGAVFAVLMPLIFRFGIENVPISDATLLNTIVGSLFALTTGFFFFRRLIDYPGTEGIAYAIPVFALTYGAASVIFLFLRLDYSRYVFGASYLLSVIWFTGISIAMTKLRTYRIGIVPGGDVLCLRSLPYAEWHVITDPGSIPIGLNA